MTEVNSSISIMVVDDHKLVLDGIKLMLDNLDGVQCKAVFASGLEALEYLHKESIDIVISDIEMPALSGIAFCEQVKARFPNVRLIALTMLVQHSVIQNMIEAGADGFLIKNSGSDELVFAIKEVQAGRTYYSKEVKDKIKSGLVRKGSTKKIAKLSKREKDIVRLILDQKNTNEIAQKLYISAGTVETHRRNIMNKLGTKNAAGLVKFVIENRLV